MSMPIRIAIFASGQGTNALKLLETATTLKQTQIPLVVVDRADSPLPEKIKARFSQVKVALIPFADSKEKHEQMILSELKAHEIDWCFLAGYMRIVGPTLLEAFSSTDGTTRILNIHPSLLPAYPGKNAYEQAFQANESVSGVTIHFVDSGIDTGQIVIQQSFLREDDDTLEDFKQRGQRLEWELYSKVLKKLDQMGVVK